MSTPWTRKRMREYDLETLKRFPKRRVLPVEKIYDEWRKGRNALEIAEILECSPATVAGKLLMIGATDSYSVIQKLKRKRKCKTSSKTSSLL